MIATRPRTAALEELSFWIGRAYYNYKLLLERTLRGLGLDRHVSPGMGHILFTLFEEDGCILRDIAARTRLSSPTITVMLRRMEKAGLVGMRRDERDGRAVRVRLTTLGRSIETRCWRALARLNSVLGRGLTPKEVEIAKRALARMVENMQKDEVSEDGS
jgi:DNA-binding MarR family transcriptional regulator